MPLKNGRFTPQENVFIQKMVATGDATYAASQAGYGSPARRGSQALANPAIVEEIRRLQQQRIHTEVLPLAVDQHIALLTDERVPAGAKANAIGLAYKFALRPDADGGDGDEPHLWPLERIQKEIAKGARLLEELSRPTLELAAEPGGIFD